MVQAVFGIIIFIGVIYAIGYVLAFILCLILFVSANGIVLSEKLMGSWAIFPPILSWAFNGFVLGGLLYFAVLESGKLNRPNVKGLLIFISCIFVLFTPVLGPATNTISLNLSGIPEGIHGVFSGWGISKTSELGKEIVVPKNQISSNKEEAVGKFVCKAPKGINLRLGPSTKHRVLGVIKYGEKIRMLGKEPSQTDSRYFYYKVKTEAGNIGFVWAGRNDEWFVPSTLGKGK